MLLPMADLLADEGKSRDFNWKESLEVPVEGAVVLGPVVVALRAKAMAGEVSCLGTINCQVELTCSRCLETFILSLEIILEETLFSESRTAELDPKVRVAKEDEGLIVKGVEVELRDLVKEKIVFALPMKALCGEECAGLCSKCGKNLNLGPCDCVPEDIDPRLEILSRWLRPEE